MSCIGRTGLLLVALGVVSLGVAAQPLATPYRRVEPWPQLPMSMNAGAFGAEMADIVTAVDALGRDGRRRLGPVEMGFSYRHSKADENLIFVSAELRGRADLVAAVVK